MPARNHAPIGAPCWIELATSDADRARTFYTELFGWSAEEPVPDFANYFNFRQNDVRVAGAWPFQPGGAGQADTWAIYLASDDAAKTVELATAHGAHVVAEAMAVADLGTMAVLIDPTGAGIGVWQPARHPGFGLIGEHGTPTWFELLTRDYTSAVDFYREVFRWHTEAMGDTAEFRYTVQTDGEDRLAGIMDATAFLPADAPAHWSVYFWVDDTDAAVAAVQRLGGTVVYPAEDTPYGKLATVADPMGAQFKLMAANDQMPAR